MEYVSAILYHKIQDSDFTNMYGIKKPSGGGGQTYIQAAGYDFSELDRMFAESDIITDTLEFWDSEKIFPRKKYKDRKSTRLNSSHVSESRMPSSA